MLKRVIAIFLIISSLSASFTRFFVYAGFELNKEYISNNLCENIAKPWMHCNGQCYLMKKLKLAEQKEKKQEQQEKRSRYQEALPVLYIYAHANVELIPKISYPELRISRVVDRPFSIFQPPKIA